MIKEMEDINYRSQPNFDTFHLQFGPLPVKKIPPFLKTEQKV